MANIFFTADQHWNHKGILRFISPLTKQPMRPFATVDEMNEAMVDRWNGIVKPPDKVYQIGDVGDLAFLSRCHGHKRLVRGNHDDEKSKKYMECFEEIYGSRVFDDMILSHIPLHIASIKNEWTCVHGHVHSNVPPLHFGPKYFNVCVEYTDYRPLALEEVRQRIKAQTAEWERLHSVQAVIAGMKE